MSPTAAAVIVIPHERNKTSTLWEGGVCLNNRQRGDVCFLSGAARDIE